MTILPPSVTSEDPESQKTSPRTCRCLDYFLVVSVLLLTVAVGSICAFYMAWERPHQERHQEKLISEKIQRDRLRNSALFTVDSVTMVNRNLSWKTNDLQGTYLGQDISYDDTTQEVLVKNKGYYFIYSQMTLRCVEAKHCSEKGNVTILVQKENQDEVMNLYIPDGSLSSYFAKIEYLAENTKLKVQLRPGKETISWQLEQSSFMGLFMFSEDLPNEDI